MGKKFSIIIPVFNVENYLVRCIQSVLNQTYTDFEVLLIDDGSTDFSGSICDEYSGRDNRITVIHKINGGLSSARNAGLDVAKGDYICFLDSDDYIDEKMLEILYESIETDRLDCIMFNSSKVNLQDKEKLIKYNATGNIISGIELMQEMISSGNLWVPVWLYCYNSTVLKENNIRFKEGILSEDEHFTPRALAHCKSVIYIDRELYFYVYRMGSIMGSKNVNRILKRRKDLIETAFELEKFYNDNLSEEQSFLLRDYLAVLYIGSVAEIKQYENYRIDKSFLKRNAKTKRTRMKGFLLCFNSNLYLHIANKRRKI